MNLRPHRKIPESSFIRQSGSQESMYGPRVLIFAAGKEPACDTIKSRSLKRTGHISYQASAKKHANFQRSALSFHAAFRGGDGCNTTRDHCQTFPAANDDSMSASVEQGRRGPPPYVSNAKTTTSLIFGPLITQFQDICILRRPDPAGEEGTEEEGEALASPASPVNLEGATMVERVICLSFLSAMSSVGKKNGEFPHPTPNVHFRVF